MLADLSVYPYERSETIRQLWMLAGPGYRIHEQTRSRATQRKRRRLTKSTYLVVMTERAIGDKEESTMATQTDGEFITVTSARELLL